MKIASLFTMFTLLLRVFQCPGAPPCCAAGTCCGTPLCTGGPPPPPGFPIDSYIMVLFFVGLLFGIYILRRMQRKLSA